MKPKILNVENLSFSYRLPTLFFQREKKVKVLENISFAISEGETLGLIGASGSGKSTLGRCAIDLLRCDSGSVLWRGKVLNSLSHENWKRSRQKLQIIFQDPYASLNPRMTVEEILSEPFEIHGLLKEASPRLNQIYKLLNFVGLHRESLDKFPFEFSGGQRQRIAIARALACEPEIIVCDEATSSLDVSLQAQIVNLLKDLQKEFGMAYLFISHDLRIVRYISDRVAVLDKGSFVEIGTAAQIFDKPSSNVTKKLVGDVLEAKSY